MSKEAYQLIFLFWSEAEFDFNSPCLEELVERYGFEAQVVNPDEFWIGNPDGALKVKSWVTQNDFEVLDVPRWVPKLTKLYISLEVRILKLRLFSARKMRPFLHKICRKALKLLVNPAESPRGNLVLITHYRPGVFQAYLEASFPDLKTICVPHYPGFLQAKLLYEAIPEYDLSAWAETSRLSDLSHRVYRDRSHVIGFKRPIVNLPQPSNVLHGKKIFLILQKRWLTTGYDQTSGLQIIRDLIAYCGENGLELLIKPHPKSSPEIHSVLNSLDPKAFRLVHEFRDVFKDCFCCISFVSTAPIYSVANQIPTFLLCPSYVERRKQSLLDPSFVYDNEKQIWTNSYIEYSIFEHVVSIVDFTRKIANRTQLVEIQKQQHESLNEHFPSDPARRLSNIIEKL